MQSTAKSWDSYMDTLLAVLDEIRPANVLEFGTGKSTKMLAMYQSVIYLHSVEHDKEWFERIKALELPNTTIDFIPNVDDYAKSFPKDRLYGVIFVDGANRARCLREVKGYLSANGAIVLHDAMREEYQDAINEYPYKILTDDGHTATLMTCESTHKALCSCLSSVKNLIGVKG